MNRITSIIAAVLVGAASLVAVVQVANAQGAAIRQRMQERLPRIDSLKSAGLIGENNKGFLSVRGSVSGEDTSIITSENADRAEVYAAIAQKAGTDAAEVGRKRAEQIRERAVPGSWLQDAAGSWYQK